MTKRELGKRLENLIASSLSKIDPKARPTKGSGASTEIADILNKYFYIESKARSTDSITIKRDVWIKLCGEVPIGSLKIPLYVLENKHRDTWAVLDFKDFIRLMEELYAKTNKI